MPVAILAQAVLAQDFGSGFCRALIPTQPLRAPSYVRAVSCWGQSKYCSSSKLPLAGETPHFWFTPKVSGVPPKCV